MSSHFFNGIKHGLGVVLVLFFITGIYAVGFHHPHEIVPGVFTGNYSFDGNLGIGLENNSPKYKLDVDGHGRINERCYDSGKIRGDYNRSSYEDYFLRLEEGWNNFDIEFNAPFKESPSVTVTVERCYDCSGANSISYQGLREVTKEDAIISIYDSSSTGVTDIHWIAIGKC